MPAGAFSFDRSAFVFRHIHHAARPSPRCLRLISDRMPAFKCQKEGKRHFSALPVTHLFTDRSRHRHGKRTDISAAQVLPFPLVTEELQFSFFLVVQAVAVAHLKPKTSKHAFKLNLTSTGLIRVSVPEKKKASLSSGVGKKKPPKCFTERDKTH